MAAVVLVNPLDVATRLSQLGLREDYLVNAIVAGERFRNGCTKLHPKISPGFYSYSETVVGLRIVLVPVNWTIESDRNFEVIVSPDGSFAIAVATGDAGTGQPNGYPRIRNARGPVTVSAVNSNQMLLFEPEIPPEIIRGRKTWILLRRRTGDKVFAELSLAMSIEEDRRTCEWDERIILSTIDLNPLTMPDREDGDDSGDIDVPVGRRS